MTPGQIGSKEIRIGMEIRNKVEFRIKLEIRNIRSQKGSKESRNRLEIQELGLKPKFGLLSQGDNGEHRPPPPLG